LTRLAFLPYQNSLHLLASNRLRAKLSSP
jgi:hypothetical protein